MLAIKILIVLLIICLILILYFKHESANHFTNNNREYCDMRTTDNCEEGEHCCLFGNSGRLNLIEIPPPSTTAVIPPPSTTAVIPPPSTLAATPPSTLAATPPSNPATTPPSTLAATPPFNPATTKHRVGYITIHSFSKKGKDSPDTLTEHKTWRHIYKKQASNQGVWRAITKKDTDKPISFEKIKETDLDHKKDSMYWRRVYLNDKNEFISPK